MKTEEEKQKKESKRRAFALALLIVAFACLAMLIVRIWVQDYIGAVGWLMGSYATAWIAADQAKAWRESNEG